MVPLIVRVMVIIVMDYISIHHTRIGLSNRFQRRLLLNLLLIFLSNMPLEPALMHLLVSSLPMRQLLLGRKDFLELMTEFLVLSYSR